MLSAAGSPLVAGSFAPTNNMAKKVKVLRAFMLDGKPTKVGDVVDVPHSVALDVVASKKAEPVEEQPEAPVPAKRKEKANAG